MPDNDTPLGFEIEFTGGEDGECFINADGKRVAKRDPDKRTWISLEPGYTVRDIGGYPPTGIEIEYEGKLTTIQ
jgi:hypothetical protein